MIQGIEVDAAEVVLFLRDPARQLLPEAKAVKAGLLGLVWRCLHLDCCLLVGEELFVALVE